MKTDITNPALFDFLFLFHFFFIFTENAGNGMGMVEGVCRLLWWSFNLRAICLTILFLSQLLFNPIFFPFVYFHFYLLTKSDVRSRTLGPCLLPPKIPKIFKIFRHIESLGTCMEY